MQLLKSISKIIPSSLFIPIVYYHHFHYFPNIKNPRTFNEKLQWLKLHDHQPYYIEMVDKCTAKQFAAKIIGEEHIIPTIATWESAEQIDFKCLPNEFVLKCNHDSGSVFVCKDKSQINEHIIREKFRNHLNNNAYWYGREWPYKYITPKILAEKYIVNNTNSDELTDYKFYCFNGYVDCVMVCYDRASGNTKFFFFDEKWNLKRLNLQGQAAPDDFTIPKPECLNEMFDMARKLSKGIPFVRVDLYEASGKVYFGEMTLYPSSGFDPNYLPNTDYYFGKLIDLSKVK